MDVWRLQHPTDRDYSFFSHVHKSYTRIDLFLIDAKLIPGVLQSKYHSILISDHAPLTMLVQLALPQSHYAWRFNPSLLSEKTFHDQMKTRLTEFMDTNDTGDVSDSTLWESLKVVMTDERAYYGL